MTPGLQGSILPFSPNSLITSSTVVAAPNVAVVGLVWRRPLNGGAVREIMTDDDGDDDEDGWEDGRATRGS